MATSHKAAVWKRIVPGKQDGKAPSVVDDGVDWDLEIDKYNQTPNAKRTASVVDRSADWDQEVDKYWTLDQKGDGEPEVEEDPDLQEDLDEMQDNYWKTGNTAVFQEMSADKKEEVQLFIQKLKDLKIKTVVFDLDRTSCRQHSGGILKRDDLDKYIASISPDFQLIVPRLLDSDFKVSLASFTDVEFYSNIQPKETHIAGEALMEAFLKGGFNEGIAANFFLVGYYPVLHEDYERNKSKHLKRIRENFHVESEEIALFDDTSGNIRDAVKDNVHAFHTDPKQGFRLQDLLQTEKKAEEIEVKDGEYHVDSYTADDLADSEED